MLNQEDEKKIRQYKFNALVAVQLHRKRIHALKQRNQVVEFLSIAVPAFYLTPRLLAQGTLFANAIDNLGEILAAVLLALAILKLVSKWQDDEVKHTMMSRRNAEIVDEADRLLQNHSTNDEVLEQFTRRVRDVDAEDEILLLDVKEVDKRKANRNALKEFSPSDTTYCFVCGADPWKFKPGTCDACGGTPVRSRNKSNVVRN